MGKLPIHASVSYCQPSSNHGVPRSPAALRSLDSSQDRCVIGKSSSLGRRAEGSIVVSGGKPGGQTYPLGRPWIVASANSGSETASPPGERGAHGSRYTSEQRSPPGRRRKRSYDALCWPPKGRLGVGSVGGRPAHASSEAKALIHAHSTGAGSRLSVLGLPPSEEVPPGPCQARTSTHQHPGPGIESSSRDKHARCRPRSPLPFKLARPWPH